MIGQITVICKSEHLGSQICGLCGPLLDSKVDICTCYTVTVHSVFIYLFPSIHFIVSFSIRSIYRWASFGKINMNKEPRSYFTCVATSPVPLDGPSAASCQLLSVLAPVKSGVERISAPRQVGVCADMATGSTMVSTISLVRRDIDEDGPNNDQVAHSDRLNEIRSDKYTACLRTSFQFMFTSRLSYIISKIVLFL